MTTQSSGPVTWCWDALAGGVEWAAKSLVEEAATTTFLASLAFFLLVCLIHRMAGRAVWTRAVLASAGASVAIALLNFVVYPIMLATSTSLFQRAFAFLHVPRLPASTWQDVPTWLLLVIVVVTYDLVNYWNHRLMHWKWLWPIHAIHHSDPEITALTTHRVHPLEALFMWMSYFVLLGWLSFPPNVLGAGAVIVLLHNQYVHVNVDWNHGKLWFLVASPRYHRWHHADVPEAHGKNLANIFPVFDVLFGTYYDPGPCRARVGAEGVPENDVVKLMLYPFVAWGALVGRTAARLRSRVAASE